MCRFNHANPPKEKERLIQWGQKAPFEKSAACHPFREGDCSNNGYRYYKPRRSILDIIIDVDAQQMVNMTNE